MNLTFMYGLGVFEGVRGYWNAEEKVRLLIPTARAH